jgi:hypothetical protein
MMKTALNFMVATGLLVIFSITNAYAGFCDKYDCEGTADRTISDDSESWFFNRYDKGSAKVRSVWESPSGMIVKITVDYTYNGGRKGWVEIEGHDGIVYCLRYHDFPNECRTHKKR